MKIQQLTELVRKTCLQSGLRIRKIGVTISTDYKNPEKKDLLVTVFYQESTEEAGSCFTIYQYNIGYNQIQIDKLLKEVELEVIKRTGSKNVVEANLEIGAS
jgi:hypothetical protein